MAIGIYKITNKINNKVYIGQSVHIERRWSEHCFPSKESVIAKAIKEYGKENFLFEIIEECNVEELDAREKYWIQYYDCMVPNGYNVADVINTTHSTYYYYNTDILNSIINDLQNSSMLFVEIADKYNLHVSTISRINYGYIHKQDNLNYPLREKNNNSKIVKIQKKYCIDCGTEISVNATRCNKCECYNRRKDLPITRDELKQLIRTKSFSQIGKDYSVTDNAIRKWCDRYELPRKKSDIKSYSNEEWENI